MKTRTRQRGAYRKAKPTHRECGVCKLVKPLDDMERNASLKHGYGYRCRPCASEETRRQRMKKYGISVEEYDALLARQNGTCAICKGPQHNGRQKRMHVDHCHETGLVRGLLCSRCNRGIGFFGHRADWMASAAGYLNPLASFQRTPSKRS